jgi:hypothetical protein
MDFKSSLSNDTHTLLQHTDGKVEKLVDEGEGKMQSR